MTNPHDDFAGLNFPPLNAMSPDYDMAMQPMGDANFESVEMFMDPQFWAMDNMAQGGEHDQPFNAFDVNALANSTDQKFVPPVRTQGPQPASYYQPELSSPTTVARPPTSSGQKQTPSSSHSKRESISKKSPATDESGDENKASMDVSAEEDKRRRNTAASARFRVKKKQREQAMEKTAREMTDKCNNLESRVKELEKENSLLKGLLTEKARGIKGKHHDSSSSDEESVRASKRTKVEDTSR